MTEHNDPDTRDTWKDALEAIKSKVIGMSCGSDGNVKCIHDSILLALPGCPRGGHARFRPCIRGNKTTKTGGQHVIVVR